MVKWASLSALVVFEGKQKAHLIGKGGFLVPLGPKSKKTLFERSEKICLSVP